MRACPLHAHWLDGEPLGGVLAMAGIVDRYRRFVVDGSPVATGFVAVADAWSCTNPSAERGLTVGFLHAQRLRDAARGLNDPAALVKEFDARTETEIRPWYDAQVAVDRARFADMNALREGNVRPPPADALAAGARALVSTMALDPELYRAALEGIGTITPVQRILARPSSSNAFTRARQAQGHRAAGNAGAQSTAAARDSQLKVAAAGPGATAWHGDRWRRLRCPDHDALWSDLCFTLRAGVCL